VIYDIHEFLVPLGVLLSPSEQLYMVMVVSGVALSDDHSDSARITFFVD
jgi:hypothetical protein